MLIKKIMDIFEKKSPEYNSLNYNNIFKNYNNIFKNYSDVKFFNFAIKHNIGISETLREKATALYIKSKKIINILNKYSKKIRLKLYKKYDNDRDLHYNRLDIYKQNEIIIIIQNKTIYKFRILDLIYIWKLALFKSENMFSMPKELKNPFTNVVFKNHNLYNIFFCFNKTTYVVPEIILSFFKCSFYLDKFKRMNYPFLQENAIEYYGKNAPYNELIEYLYKSLHFFRKDLNYIFLKSHLPAFKKRSIVKKMENIIILYLKYIYLCNPLLRESYCYDIKLKLTRYFNHNFSSNMFFKLNHSEQIFYENNGSVDISLNISPPPMTTLTQAAQAVQAAREAVQAAAQEAVQSARAARSARAQQSAAQEAAQQSAAQEAARAAAREAAQEAARAAARAAAREAAQRNMFVRRQPSYRRSRYSSFIQSRNEMANYQRVNEVNTSIIQPVVETITSPVAPTASQNVIRNSFSLFF